jgi:hypothetical protein
MVSRNSLTISRPLLPAAYFQFVRVSYPKLAMAVERGIPV